LWLLTGAVFFVLLIAATNVAGLSLARGGAASGNCRSSGAASTAHESSAAAAKA
jgi:hypothetical protein